MRACAVPGRRRRSSGKANLIPSLHHLAQRHVDFKQVAIPDLIVAIFEDDQVVPAILRTGILEALDKQIGDLLVLALTTTKLRAVVTMFKTRLGASITDVERQILGIEEDDKS